MLGVSCPTMKRRPSVFDRIAALMAGNHARRVYEGFQAATRRATEVQERVLLAKIRRNADSDFGRKYHFDRIRSAADFARELPILRYEDFRPYVERVKAGERSALFGGRQRVHMFAMSSGTTEQPKYIPVTDAFLNEYRQGWNAFGIKALLDHPVAMLRGIVQVSSRMDEARTQAGIPCGAITGLMAATQKRLVRKYYITPRCLAEIDDAAAKHYTIMRLAVPADAAFVITASPATQLKLARTADDCREQIIRDVHDGTLRADLPVPSTVREMLRPRLKTDVETARHLEAIVRQHGRLLPRHYWDLAFLANWTGGTMGLYLQEFPEYFGDVPVRDVGLLASEGRVSIPVDDGTPAGILEVTSNFFEFVPRDRMEETSPRAFRSHEVEVGQEYFVLLTTSSGLYRYDLGDLVRVVGFAGQAPIIEFLNKGAHISSMAGEKLTEHQVILAMEKATAALRLTIASFVLAPRWADPPYYLLHVEPFSHPTAVAGNAHPTGHSAGVAPAEWLDRLASMLDEQLHAVNVEYAGKRQSARLAPVRGHLLRPGVLAELDRSEADRYRKGNEQHKHRYLYVRPGEDAAFSG